jgi:hypothetical protein
MVLRSAVVCEGLRSAGILPAIFLISMQCKNAGGTPALPNYRINAFELLWR